MKTSSFFSVDFRDTLHGLIVAVGGAAIGVAETSLQAGKLELDWKAIGGIALAAGLSYMGKKFFTPAQCITPAEKPSV